MKENRPRVCFVALNAFPLLSGDPEIHLIGGAELQQVLVARLLAKRGYSVSMICLDFGQDAEVEIDGITVYRAYKPNKGIPILRFLWPRLTSIWRCLKRANADIYYQRTAGMLTGIVVAYCRHHRKKSIFAAAGNPDLQQKTPRIQYSRDRWLYEFGLQHVDRILVQNFEQRNLCKVNYGRDAICVPNCYPAASLKSACAKKYVLWVSTIRRIKQPELFVKLAERFPHHQFCMIGGPSDDEVKLFETIRARAEKIQNLAFLGFVPFLEVEKYFDESTIFVNTSESEGFPNTFLQAWSRAVPTISFVDCGAFDDEGPIGARVSTAQEMALNIRTWLTDETKRAREGERCLEYFEKTHLPEKILDQYMQIFDDLIAIGG